MNFSDSSSSGSDRRGRSYGVEDCFLPSFHRGLGRACWCGPAGSGGCPSLPPGGNARSPSRWLSGGQVEPGARGSQGEDPACSLEAKRDGLGMKSKQANYLLTLKAHVLIRRGAISPPHRCRHFPGAAPAGAARCRALAAEGSRRPAAPCGRRMLCGGARGALSAAERRLHRPEQAFGTEHD